MSTIPVFASTLGQIFQPLFQAMAWLIAFFYALIPNYAVAIALLTVTVMAITAPLTIKSTRSMLAMQRLQPELKKLQAKYKGDRVALNEEMMKLYKEHSVNPAGGCLPMIIQLPVFFILYDVIRGLTHTVTVNGHVVARPYYISKDTSLYQALAATPGEMKAFGINLADSLFSPQSSWVAHIPFAVLVGIAIALQYLTMRQMNRRNPAAAQAMPQMQTMQKYMPLIFAVIYLRIAAGVNIYFIVSALCRMGLQWWAFRLGVKEPKPRLAGGGEVLPGQAGAGAGGAPRRRSLMDRFSDMQQQALEQQKARKAALEAQSFTGDAPRPAKEPPPTKRPPNTNGTTKRAPSAGPAKTGSTRSGDGGSGNGTAPKPGAKASPPSASGGNSSNGAGNGKGAAGSGDAAPDGTAKTSHPRSKAKKTRKAR